MMNEQIPHFSTISYNFKRRYTEQTIEEIFYWIFKGDPKITEKIKKGRKGPRQQQESAPHNGDFGAYRDADIYDKPVCRRRLQGAFTQAAAPWLIMGIGVAAPASYSSQTQDSSKKC